MSISLSWFTVYNRKIVKKNYFKSRKPLSLTEGNRLIIEIIVLYIVGYLNKKNKFKRNKQ